VRVVALKDRTIPEHAITKVDTNFIVGQRQEDCE
jgi:hypothetical protein